MTQKAQTFIVFHVAELQWRSKTHDSSPLLLFDSLASLTQLNKQIPQAKSFMMHHF